MEGQGIDMGEKNGIGSIVDRRGHIGRRLLGRQTVLLIRRLYEWLDDWLHPKRIWGWRQLREAEILVMEDTDHYRFAFGNGTFYLSGLGVAAGKEWASAQCRAIRVITDANRKNRAEQQRHPSQDRLDPALGG